MTVSIPGYCTLCRSRCGTLNDVEHDMLISVQPDPDHPTGQAMCTKGRAAPEIVHSVTRQLYPMRRTMPKGSADPGWKRIGWDEALAETARRLNALKQENGAESVAFAVTTPSGTPLSDSIDWIERFVRHFGSPNICYGTEICNWHKDFAHAFTFGCGIPPADYENAETILLWGHNPANTWLAQASAIARGRAKGARMVVVDPRPTALARQADVWLRVRPGTDAALALGLIRHLIEGQHYDDEFVRSWTNAPLLVRSDTGTFLRERDTVPGSVSDRFVAWDEVSNEPVPIDPYGVPAHAERWKLRGEVSVAVNAPDAAVNCRPAFDLLVCAAASYDDATVRSITGVEARELGAAAELLHGGRRIAYHAWTGLGQHTNATQSERAVATLYALSGSFDRIGGNRVGRGPFFQPVNAVRHLSAQQRAKALGIRQRPIGPPAMGWVTARDMYAAILDAKPYKIRGLVAFGTNLPVSQAETRTAEAALQALEFHVHCDLFETPAARHADIFLPVNSPWEHEGLRIGFEISDDAASLVQLRQRMVSPRGESRSDNEIVFDLASRLGMAEEFFGGSLEAGWNHMLSPLGLDVAALRDRPKGVKVPVDSRERKYSYERQDDPARMVGFETETRRVEIYSELLHRHGQPGIASYIPPDQGSLRGSGRANDGYPLTLSSAKNGNYCHSQHRSLVSLRKRALDPLAEISPALAAARDIGEGDWIRISTREGHARFVARITPELADDVVVAEFGWWQGCVELDRPETPVTGDDSSNFNSLISSEISDPVSGSTPLRSSRCNIELDPRTERRQRLWKGYRAFRVVELQKQTEDVLSVRFEPVDGGELPDYRAGQHVEVRIRAGTEYLNRSYSLTGAARVPQRKSYSIAVRHNKGVLEDGSRFAGAASTYIHTRLEVGQIVELKAPAGSFLLPGNSPQPLVLLAAGIGITPFVSLLETLPDGDPAEIWLFYGNSNGRAHAFERRIAFHATRLPGLKVINHYSRPDATDRLGTAHQAAGRIGAELIADDLIRRRSKVYICGPSAMMESCRRDLIARGVPRFDIFNEVFRSPVMMPPEDGRTLSVSFRQSRKAPDQWSAAKGTLLSFGESLGVSLPSGCRVGQCESCAVRIVSGSVVHLGGSEPDDPSVCLACQAIPATDVVLDA